MDKTTVSEYGYTIIAAIVALIIILFLTGSYFDTELKGAVEEFVPNHEQYDHLSNRAYAKYIEEVK